MKNITRAKVIDWLLIALMIVPFVLAIALKVMFKPGSEDISITGAMVYFTIPMPLMDLPITEAQVSSVAVLLCVLGLCLYLTHGIAVRPQTKRQLAAEWIVEKVTNLVEDNMGPRFMGYVPFVGAILAISALSSLSTLVKTRILT